MIRMLRVTALASAALLLAGCAAQPGPDDWTLEPVTLHFSNGSTDLAFGMHELAADSVGGFWATSGTTWMHVDADGETADFFNAEPGTQLGSVDHIATHSPTTLVVAFGGAGIADQATDAGAASGITPPGLGILDTATRDIRVIPTPFWPDPHALVARVVDLDVHGETAIVALQRTGATWGGAPALDIVAVPLDGSTTTLIHSEPFVPALPPESVTVVGVSIDIAEDGRIFVATRAAQFAPSPDGAELWREAQPAKHPVVASGPDGSALWWGGEFAGADSPSVIVGGSGDARTVIEGREACAAPYRQDALTLRSAEARHPLSFLCGANTAAWIGDGWLVALGGEGDGVLVRVTPPPR